MWIKYPFGGGTPDSFYADTKISKAEAFQISISLYGNKRVINFNTRTKHIGGADYNEIMTLNSSTLIADTTLYNNKSLLNHNSDIIINEFKDGKQVITLKCCVHNMYDENGNKVIDIKGDRKLLHIGDIVCPYKTTVNGDRPYGVKQDGSNKSYRVISHKLEFDGGIWQTITLQEVV